MVSVLLQYRYPFLGYLYILLAHSRVKATDTFSIITKSCLPYTMAWYFSFIIIHHFYDTEMYKLFKETRSLPEGYFLMEWCCSRDWLYSGWWSNF